MIQAGLRTHEWRLLSGASRPTARLPISRGYSGKRHRLDSFTVAGAAPESRQHCVQVRSLTGFPVSLCRHTATEHLEQAAKVSGLGVERQLKLALHLNHPTAALLYPYRY